MITFNEIQFTALIVGVVIATILLYHFLVGSRFKCENICVNKCKNLDDFTSSSIAAYAQPVNAGHVSRPKSGDITADLDIFK